LPTSYSIVVEGYINSGIGATNITISRTTKLNDTTSIIYEPKATVTVEGKTNPTSFQLTEILPGRYSIAQLTLNPNDQYRLKIKTSNGKIYLSAYSGFRTTPAIDSISWKQNNDGVEIYANTHDPQSKSKYYQYIYEETWEFHSRFTQSIKLTYNTNGNIKGVGYKDSATFGSDSTIFKCWKSSNSSTITIATSEQLTEDIISNKILLSIPYGSWKLSQLYTILVKQRTLSKEGYQFLEQLKKNTEQTGSIFDAQPSGNNGNFTCTTNPNEIVVGFVEVTEEKEKRIWIKNSNLASWIWNTGCEAETKYANHPDSLVIFPQPSGMMLTNVAETNPASSAITYVFGAASSCVDCRLLGSNKKPIFWP
jgi:hypothetical protein